MRINLVLSVAGLVVTGSVVSTTIPMARGGNETLVQTTTAACTSDHLVSTACPTEIRTAGTMRVDKKLYRRGDIMEVNFSMPHGPYFAIRNPSGRFFYVVFPRDQAVEKLTPIVDSRTFSGMSSLRIDTQTLKADPYTHGILENQPVFTETGTYTLIMGHNLHVDDESELAVLRINYRHERAAGSHKSPAKHKKNTSKKHGSHSDVAAL